LATLKKDDVISQLNGGGEISPPLTAAQAAAMLNVKLLAEAALLRRQDEVVLGLIHAF
jgi:hypothetical protein